MSAMNATKALRSAVVAAALGFGVATAAVAGRSCEARPTTPETIASAMALAERTAAALDKSGAQVVVIGRAGQDLSAHGIRWSHLGFAYRPAPDASWRVVHKLNHCGAATATLYRQGLGDFFLDDLWRYEAAIVVLAPEVQSRLVAALADNARISKLDSPAYSMVAYPWSTRFQQSNQWAIETLAMHEHAGAGSREGAQAWLRLKDYRPATLRIGSFERVGARMTTANVSFDDHPNEKRLAGRIETVTVDSVFTWLERSGLGGRVEIIR